MTVEKKDIVIKEPLRKVGDAFKEGASIDDKGTILPSPELYEKLLKENGFDIVNAKKQQKFDQLFRAGCVLGAGELAVERVIASPDTESVTIKGEVPMGEDRFLLQFERLPKTETDPEQFEQWGRIRVKADGNTADMKAARGFVNELYATLRANNSKAMQSDGE